MAPRIRPRRWVGMSSTRRNIRRRWRSPDPSTLPMFARGMNEESGDEGRGGGTTLREAAGIGDGRSAPAPGCPGMHPDPRLHPAPPDQASSQGGPAPTDSPLPMRSLGPGQQPPVRWSSRSRRGGSGSTRGSSPGRRSGGRGGTRSRSQQPPSRRRSRPSSWGSIPGRCKKVRRPYLQRSLDPLLGWARKRSMNLHESRWPPQRISPRETIGGYHPSWYIPLIIPVRDPPAHRQRTERIVSGSTGAPPPPSRQSRSRWCRHPPTRRFPHGGPRARKIRPPSSSGDRRR